MSNGTFQLSDVQRDEMEDLVQRSNDRGFVRRLLAILNLDRLGEIAELAKRNGDILIKVIARRVEPVYVEDPHRTNDTCEQCDDEEAADELSFDRERVNPLHTFDRSA